MVKIRVMDSKRIRFLLVPIVAAVIVAALFLSGVLEGIEVLTLDYRLRTFSGGIPPPVAFVAIDSDTIKQIGTWPIPRGFYGQVLQKVRNDGAQGILVDIDFSSTGPDPDEDRALVDAVRGTRNVFLPVHKAERRTQEGALIRSISLPIARLMEASPGLGSITFEVDPDGAVRRIPAPIDFGDDIFHPMGIVGARILDPEVPLDYPDGAMINLSHKNLASRPVVSFAKVLEGDFEPGIFRDRIVILGATAPELHDYWLTPMGVVPGIYIQAALMETALNRSWHIKWGLWPSVGAIFLVSIILAQFLGRSGRLKGFLYTAGAIILLVITAALFAWGSRMIPVVPLIAVAILQYPFHVAIQAWGTETTLAQVREKTDAILKLSELERAGASGREDIFAPLILLRQVLKLEKILLYRIEEAGDQSWKVESVLGEKPNDENIEWGIIRSVLESREILSTRDSRAGKARVYVPMMASKLKYGVLFVEGPWEILKDRENLRLLLSYSTQASYHFETWDLDQKVKFLYTNTIRAITRALDSRDHFTSAHSELSLEYVEKFGRACGLSRVQIEALHIGTLLHDIGKIGTPDSILNKKGKLTPSEFEVLKQHPKIGHEIIRDLPFPTDVKMVVLHHHEWFDGSGYPAGLKGKDIPFLARIFSVLDTYEALIGVRPYKDPMDPEKARSILRKESGTHFDPELLDIFLSISEG